MVEKELELSLGEGYTIFQEEHDSSTLEPIYDKGFTLLKELHDTTHMDPSHDEIYEIFYHLGELFHSPTSYNSMFCSISLNEVSVKGLFFMVPHEEYGTPRFNFYDDMVGEHSYSNLQQHALLLYDYAHLHGCTYDIHLSHLKNHGFSCSTLGSFDVGGTSPNTGVNRIMIGEIFCCYPHTLLYLYDFLIHGCMGENYLSHLKSPCFSCSLFGSDFSGDSSFTSWMK